MSRNYKITALIIVVIISLSGGVIGGLIFRSYLINSFFGIPLWGDINLSDDYQQGRVVISQPKKVIVEQNDRISEVISKAVKNKVNFYVKKQSAVSKTTDDFDIKEYYLPKDKAGEGLILTNDGWIITAVKINKPLSYIAADHEGNIINIEESFLDKMSGYYFVKINANDLSVAQFAETKNLGVGQLTAIFSENKIKIAYIEEINYSLTTGLAKSSEESLRYLKINTKDLNQGDISFSLDSSAVGLYAGDGTLIPINYFKKLLPSLLKDKKIVRPVLGINYIMLDQLIGEQKLSGAIIAKNTRGVAVEKNSSAAIAGLKEGDIILEIEGRKINQINNLSDIILGYQVGEEIELTIIRDAEKQQVKVILGKQ